MIPETPRRIVTVCVVTFNQAHFIEDCLSSIAAQCVDADVEILVGDDASTDGTGDIVESLSGSLGKDIRLFRHPVNLGPAKNYQFLVARAVGDFVAHLDGDDFWLPKKLACQLAYLDAHPKCNAVFANSLVLGNDDRPYGVFNNPQPEVFDKDYLLRKGNFLTHSSLLYRSKLKASLLEIDGNYIDYRGHLRMAEHGPMGYINRVLVVYRYGHVGSLSTHRSSLVHRLYLEALIECVSLPTTERALGRSSIEHFWSRSALSWIVGRKFSVLVEEGRRLRKESLLGNRALLRGLLWVAGQILVAIAKRPFRLVRRSCLSYLHPR